VLFTSLTWLRLRPASDGILTQLCSISIAIIKPAKRFPGSPQPTVKLYLSSTLASLEMIGQAAARPARAGLSLDARLSDAVRCDPSTSRAPNLDYKATGDAHGGNPQTNGIISIQHHSVDQTVEKRSRAFAIERSHALRADRP